MKKLMSVLLCIVILIGIVPSLTSIKASANSLEYVEANKVCNITWDASVREKYLYLTVDETGFYDVTVKNVINTGIFAFYLCDLEYDNDYSSLYNTSLILYGETEDTENNVYLIKDHLYEIECAYGYYDDNDDFVASAANLNISFIKNEYEPINIGLGDNTNLIVGNDTVDWIEFKTITSGDYSFEINQYSNVTLDVYEKASGVYVDSIWCDDQYIAKMRLEEKTEYIIRTEGNEDSAKLVRFCVSKAAKNISKIDIVQSNTILANQGYVYDTQGTFYSSDIKEFNYKVTYSDKTTKTLSYYDLEADGVWIYAIYCNSIYEYEGECFFKSGKQPVTIYYMNSLTSKSYVNITTYLEYFSYLKIKSDYDDMRIDYEGEDTHTYYWRIKPDENNKYSLYSYNWDQISGTFRIFDENNNIISQGKNLDGWPLKSGKEYCLRISYRYNENCYDDVVFDLEPNTDHVHNSSKVTTTKATTTKNGKITYNCSECAYTTSTKTIYYPKTVKLSTTSYTYNGKVKTPTVTVKDSAGKTLKKNTDYTVTYPSGRKNVGTYKVKVTFKGKYSGTKYLSFKINPINVSKCKVSLSTTDYTYNGKVKTPNVTVKNASGTKLTKNTHYTVTYASGRKKVGKYKVTIKMKGNYSGTKTLYFTIKPPKTTVSKLTAGKKSIKVTVGKKTSQVTGYQIQYATNKSFKSAKTKNITSYKTISTNLTKLTSKKTYYVRVRTYKTVSGKKYYSGWSSYKYKKTK